MKKLVFITLFLFSASYAQNDGFKLLKKINGIEIYFKSTKTTTKKTENYNIQYEYINTTGKDIYYKTFTAKENKGLLDVLNKKEAQSYENANFATIGVENKKVQIFSNRNSGIVGDKTRLKTDDNHDIYVFKKNKTYTMNIEYSSDLNTELILNVNINNDIIFEDDIKAFL